MCPESSVERRVSSPESGVRGTDSRPAARSARLAAGFSIVAAIFLLVVLALLGAAIVYVAGLQQTAHQLDILGARAYQAARAGIEWGAFQVLDPNYTLNAGDCTTPAMPACPATTDLTGLAASLSPFTVTVRCTLSTPDPSNGNRSTTEGTRSIWAYELTADACNQPTGTSCPNTGTPGQGYVSRKLTVILSKCKDPGAAAPRCACTS
jgi:MSHA biogenesis protein MshP